MQQDSVSESKKSFSVYQHKIYENESRAWYPPKVRPKQTSGLKILSKTNSFIER